MKSLNFKHKIVLFLHKSEGFGYGIAENLLLGNEIITTNYSGSKDLCSESNSFSWIRQRIRRE